jgi:hypothetical protein
MSEVLVCGVGGIATESSLEETVLSCQPDALGMATAFLSISGARSFGSLAMKCQAKEVRVVAGLSGAITQPVAIRFLQGKGFSIRLGSHAGGIFHPKILVGGNRFGISGAIDTASCGYVGSANFTAGGMKRNLELPLQQ